MEKNRFTKAFGLLETFVGENAPHRSEGTVGDLCDLEKICQKLREIECKLEELVNAFANSNINEEEAKEYATVFGDLEAAYSKVINFIAVKKGMSRLLPNPFNKDDVKKVLEVVK